ncbi:MAG: relaxase/mobilization nuclease domain-containing protein, partial [Bacteroidales bacterium]|nr:relaxase/mobilization nuclease domain-containing protein [Bacteroidales bacterium]
FSLEYNESKCATGEAVLLHTNCIDESEGIAETFRKYERRNIRTENLSFHMSVNPAPDEHLTEEQVKEFISDIMKGLGYGNQPYAVYRHTDIDREHFHVVSVRVNDQGRKIHDFQENKRCFQLLSAVAPKYGLRVGNGDGERYAAMGIDPRRFNPVGGNIMEQIRIIAEECCKYHMTSFAQFKLIMQAHGLEVTDRTGDTSQVVVRGLNQDGIPCMAPITEDELGKQLYSEYERRAMECVGRSGIKQRERARICGISASCLEHSTSERHFRNMLARFDIDIHLHRTREGRIYGATFVDHSTRCAFKSSELGAFRLDDIVTADENGQWLKKSSNIQEQSEGHELNLIGAALAGISKGSSKSQEKDMKEKKRKRKLKR